MGLLGKFHRNFPSFYATIFTRIIFGYYSDLKFTKTKSIFCRLYIIFVVIFGVCGCYLNAVNPNLSTLFYVINGVEFFLTTSFSLYYKDAYLLKLFTDYRTIDVVEVNTYGRLTCILILSATFLKIVVDCFGFYLKFFHSTISNWAILFVMLSNNVGFSSSILVFDLFWNKIHTMADSLRSSLEIELPKKAVVGTLGSFLGGYKDLITNVRIAFNVLELTLFVKVLCTFAKIIMNIYTVITAILREEVNVYTWITFYDVSVQAILFCSTIFLAEMILSEFDKIKSILGDLLFVCSDSEIRQALYQTLQYLEARPPKYTILRLFPLDINLLTGVVAICSTYVIGLLQFEF